MRQIKAWKNIKMPKLTKICRGHKYTLKCFFSIGKSIEKFTFKKCQ